MNNKMYCINCGAPMNGRSKCEYCGTEYGISSYINEGVGILHFNGEDIKVYLDSINADVFPIELGRDEDGNLVKVVHSAKRTFTLREF